MNQRIQSCRRSILILFFLTAFVLVPATSHATHNFDLTGGVDATQTLGVVTINACNTVTGLNPLGFVTATPGGTPIGCSFGLIVPPATARDIDTNHDGVNDTRILDNSSGDKARIDVVVQGSKFQIALHGGTFIALSGSLNHELLVYQVTSPGPVTLGSLTASANALSGSYSITRNGPAIASSALQVTGTTTTTPLTADASQSLLARLGSIGPPQQSSAISLGGTVTIRGRLVGSGTYSSTDQLKGMSHLVHVGSGPPAAGVPCTTTADEGNIDGQNICICANLTAVDLCGARYVTGDEAVTILRGEGAASAQPGKP